MPQRRDPKIDLVVPSFNGEINVGLTMTLLRELPKHKNCTAYTQVSSFLTKSFNYLWCEALNHDADYFLMVHADVHPTSEDWIQTMIDELKTNKADALSVVLPIKSELGLTSTGLTHKASRNMRRLTLRETQVLPETFSASALAELFEQSTRDAYLLINTGLFLVDLKKHRKKIEKLRFRVRNEIAKTRDGKFYNWAWPEDWYWSHDANELGLQLVATRKVEAIHKGSHDYCNCHVWGAWQQDEDYRRVMENAKTKRRK